MRVPAGLKCCVLCFALLVNIHSLSSAETVPPERPNILWISLEDISPDLGCYGDSYATTAVMDEFAKQGIVFTHCFTHAPVCAPSRSGLITGMYPTTIGTHHMRCDGVPPAAVRCFPEYLRENGYFCTNNAKTDYQFTSPTSAWDLNGNQAHWRGQKRVTETNGSPRPFFSVFNLMTTHESQIRDPSNETQRLRRELPASQRHDPQQAKLPTYYPDTPETRSDWASYHDNLAAAQTQIAGILQQLKEDGLEENTIVWIWGDHGRGLPRGKRWLYDSGLRVPFLLRVPPKWEKHVFPREQDKLPPGSQSRRLVAFVDFAPTILSLANVEIPRHFQGRAFLGPQSQPAAEYVFAGRDRMDERIDCSRSVRDQRYKYIRNFMWDRPYAQHVSYGEMMPTMKAWRREFAAGSLNDVQKQFLLPRKPMEELYDCQADPEETHNVAADPSQVETLNRMRNALEMWMAGTKDLGLLPEAEWDALKRPFDIKQSTATPRLQRVSEQSSNGLTAYFNCDTPGASINWRLKSDPMSTPWHLASPHHGIPCQVGQEIRIKANRIGFVESPVTTVQIPGIVLIPQQMLSVNEKPIPHGTELVQTQLEEARRFKRNELSGGQKVSDLLQAAQSDNPVVRYWSINHMMSSTADAVELNELLPTLQERLRVDPSPSVRIAAAELLCRRGRPEISLPVLFELLHHPLASVRHQSLVAIDDLGHLASSLLPALKALETELKRTPFFQEYETRVLKHLLSRENN